MAVSKQRQTCSEINNEEFVEPLMQQLAANLGDTLAGSISFAVGHAVQAAQNRDVRPRREPDHGTSQHRLLLSMSSEVQTLLCG